MRRIGGLFEAIASFENLYRAFTRASRSKRHRESVDRFSFRLEGELLRLRAELKSGTYRPGPMREFTIEDPKRRKIRAAPFRDRVLHHAVMGVLEPHFERWLDSDSYACRKGKGTDAALRRAVVLSRRGSWVLKTDVESFFATVDHGILKGLLARRLKDPRLLELLGSIIDHGGNIDHGGDTDHGTKTGMGAKGLPIGSLTSQWLANLYLAPLDRFVREALQPRGYLRYMDDFAVIADGKETLKKIRREVETWLRDALSLELKESATHLHPTVTGWPFLGFRVLPCGLRVHRQSWRLLEQRHQSAYHDFDRGRLTLAELVQSTECRMAHLKRANCDGLRRRELRWKEV